MRIAMIVTPWFPVPPAGYGGVELVAFTLARELHRRGHHVKVIGQEGTHGPFESVALAPARWSGLLGTPDQSPREKLFLHRAYQQVRASSYDVVHDHSGLTGILVAATAALSTPIVATLHNALTAAESDFLAEVDDRVHLVAISRSHMEQGRGVDWRGIVYNAIDPSGYRPVQPDEKEDYIIQLARINPAKGQHLAIEVARRLGVRLVLAGKIDPGAEDYFKNEIEPHLGQMVSWHENVAGEDKARLLARARAMIFPIQWAEPFGLAMVEAMVSGTPVLALARGAAVEVVEPGITGWLGEDLDGLVRGYGRLAEIDLRRCVEHTAKRFGPEQMGDGYEAVYRAAVSARAVSNAGRLPTG